MPGAGKATPARKRGRVTRFTVMAMLQATRAESLGLSRESSYSWGLNRAIFYAAAKRGFRGASEGSGSEEAGPAKPAERGKYRLGDDEAFRANSTGDPIFVIGDDPQTSAEFERQVAARFGSRANFQLAWNEARQIVAAFDRATLESRRRFFDDVYKPRRDELSEDWSRRFAPASDAP
jgi:hypothetical protein